MRSTERGGSHGEAEYYAVSWSSCRVDVTTNPQVHWIQRNTVGVTNRLHSSAWHSKQITQVSGYTRPMAPRYGEVQSWEPAATK